VPVDVLRIANLSSWRTAPREEQANFSVQLGSARADQQCRQGQLGHFAPRRSSPSDRSPSSASREDLIPVGAENQPAGPLSRRPIRRRRRSPSQGFCRRHERWTFSASRQSRTTALSVSHASKIGSTCGRRIRAGLPRTRRCLDNGRRSRDDAESTRWWSARRRARPSSWGRGGSWQQGGCINRALRHQEAGAEDVPTPGNFRWPSNGRRAPAARPRILRQLFREGGC